MLKFQVSELVHQLKVVILESHILPDVHKVNLSLNESPFSPLRQLSLSLLWCPLDLMKERKVEPLVEKVAN